MSPDGSQAASEKVFRELVDDRSSPMNYYCALSIVDRHTPKDAIVVNEGKLTDIFVSGQARQTRSY